MTHDIYETFIRLYSLKELFTDFIYIWVHGSVFSSGIRFTKKCFSFSISEAATAHFMVSRIGPAATLLLQVDHFGPIRETNTSTVADTGIEKMKITFVFLSWRQFRVESVNRSFNECLHICKYFFFGF